MADFTITVSLDLNATPKITLDTPDRHIPFGISSIQWVLGTAPENTTLVGLDNWIPRDPLSPDPSKTNDFTGTDRNTNETGSDEVFSYDVMLMHDGVPVPKDPEIVNDPGTGHFRLHHTSQ
jgi:hypothetical protein